MSPKENLESLVGKTGELVQKLFKPESHFEYWI